MFPALNITGVARVELFSRSLSDVENEAQNIFDGICYARRQVGAHYEMEASVNSGHKTLFRISLSRGATRSRIFGHCRDIEKLFPKI